jgi:hypothetical protein
VCCDLAWQVVDVDVVPAVATFLPHKDRFEVQTIACMTCTVPCAVSLHADFLHSQSVHQSLNHSINQWIYRLVPVSLPLDNFSAPQLPYIAIWTDMGAFHVFRIEDECEPAALVV